MKGILGTCRLDKTDPDISVSFLLYQWLLDVFGLTFQFTTRERARDKEEERGVPHLNGAEVKWLLCCSLAKPHSSK